MIHNKMRTTLLVCACAAPLMLSGCGSLLTDATPADDIYILNPPVLQASEAMTVRGRVMIDRPQLPEGLETDRIALVKAGRELDYMAGAQWSGRLDKVLQNYFENAFEASLPLGKVVSDAYAMDAAYIIVPKVTHFEAHYDGFEASEAPLAKVELSMSLIRRSDGRLIQQMALKQDVRASANSQTAIVSAFEKALADVTMKAIPLLAKR